MGSHFSRSKPEPIAPSTQIDFNPSIEVSEDKSAKTSFVYQLDPQDLTQAATDESIHIGPYTLTFELAQRIAQDLRNANASPAIAEIKTTCEETALQSGLALYNIKLQLLDDYLILLSQSWVELPPALSGVLETQHMATLFDRAHGCCSHASRDKNLAFISRMGIEIVERNRQRKCMCVEINYSCRCRTIYGCDQCPSQLIFSRHELRDGRMMLVTTNWRNLGQCSNIEDDVWRSQTVGLNLLSTESRRGQTQFKAPEWTPLRGFTGLIPYESDTTAGMRDVADKVVT